jgi:multimeric flavodoxin WrbA
MENLKAVFLVGTLKKEGDFSHTEFLSQFLAGKLKTYGVQSEVIRLIDKNIPLGLENDMGNGDEWSDILKSLFEADIVILATPIWWGSYSSLIQKIMERMNNVRGADFTKTGKSPFNNKVGGIVVSGAEDGAEYVIGHLSMFMSWVGFSMPPACSLSSLLGMNYSNTDAKELSVEYEKNYGNMAGVTAANLSALAILLKKNSIFPSLSDKIV